MKLFLHSLSLLAFSALFATVSANGQIVVTESFDSTTFPPVTSGFGGGAWRVYRNNLGTSAAWTRLTSSASNPAAAPHSGTGMASYAEPGSSQNGSTLESPVVDWSLRGSNQPTITVWVYRYSTGITLAGNMTIKISATQGTIGSSAPGTTIGTIPQRRASSASASNNWTMTVGNATVATDGWYQYTFQMPVSGTGSFSGTINYIEFTAGDANISGSISQGNYLMDDISYDDYSTPTHSNGPQWLIQNCSTCTTGCYIDGGTIAPISALQSANVATSGSNYGYVFWSFNASADSTYYFDLCSSSGTTGQSLLRLHNARISGNNYCMDVNNTPTLIIQNNPNGCIGMGVGLSKLVWTCRTSGTYYLETAAANFNFWGIAGNQTPTLSYKTLPSYSYTCADVFYDKGIDGTNGLSNSYNNNEDWIYTYYPSDTVTQAINVQFDSFSTSPGDILCVHDGNSINSPLIGCYSGPSITGAFSSSASDGSLTFHFTTDDSLISTGWQANVSCVPNVSIRKEDTANSITIYPNPVEDILMVYNPVFTPGSMLKIYDMLGEKILEEKINQQSPTSKVNVSSLASGIYIVAINAAQGDYLKKLVKK